MFRILKMIIIYLFIIVFVLLAIAFCYFFVGKAPKQDNVLWGVDFSQMQSEALKLNWKANYLALVQDLGVKNIKLHTQWDFVEGEKGKYFFDDIDWQIKTAEKYNVKIIFVVGFKTGRWPECHQPEWVKNLNIIEQQEAILKYIKETVLRYKDSSAVSMWQVENEPLLRFGECPDWYYDNGVFLKKEIALVKSLDSTRKVMVSDSGELNWWINAAKKGDLVGTTMYRKAWVNISSFGFPVKNPGFYSSYPFLPVFYYRKAQIIKALFNKDVIGVELQAEPWAHKPFYDVPLVEQEKTMDINQFKKNIEYAKKTGLKAHYLWGAEWWYWLKETQQKPEIWNEAKNLFK